MFESMINDNQIGVMTHAKPLMISAAVHAVIITMGIVLPLMFYQAIKKDVFVTNLFFPANPPVIREAPTPPSSAAGKTTGGSVRTVSLGEFVEPTKIPEGIIPAPPNDSELGLEIGPAARWGDGTGTQELGPGVQGANALNEIWKRQAETGKKLLTPPPPPTPRPEVIRIGSLNPSKILVRVQPEYPLIAATAHVSGAVVLEAIIDEDGNVTVDRIVSGHLLLRDAAIKAVNQWKYTPMIQNGEPVRVNATITVNFEINK